MIYDLHRDEQITKNACSIRLMTSHLFYQMKIKLKSQSEMAGRKGFLVSTDKEIIMENGQLSSHRLN